MKKYLKVTVPLLLVAGTAVWLILWMRAPSEGTVSHKTTGTRVTSTFQDKQLEGVYFSFQYSGKYIAGSNSPANNDLERYTLSAGTNYDKRIQAAVVNLPSRRLDSNGDYVYRQNTPTVYSKRQLQTDLGLFEIWVKQDGSEQTAMVARDNKAVVVAFLTTAGAESSLTPEVDALLKSLRWKQ